MFGRPHHANILGVNAALFGSDRPILVVFSSKREPENTNPHAEKESYTAKPEK